MTRIVRGAAVLVVVAGAILAAFAARASAEPLGGCPSGGGWQLIWSPETSPLPPPYPWGPAAARVDEQGNNDGYACKTVFTAGGMVVAQVIDNRVQAGSKALAMTGGSTGTARHVEPEQRAKGERAAMKKYLATATTVTAVAAIQPCREGR